MAKNGCAAVVFCLLSSCGDVRAPDLVGDNARPVAFDSVLSSSIGGYANGLFVAHDDEGDALQFEIVEQPKKGSVNILDVTRGVFIYTPTATTVSVDSFKFIARDQFGQSDAASVTIAIGTLEQGLGAGFVVVGFLSYENPKLICSTNHCGLDFDQAEHQPIAGATVQLLDGDSGSPIMETISQDDGSYVFTYGGSSRVRVLIFAETETPPISVRNNTQGDAVYSMLSDQVDASLGLPVNLVATTGFSDGAYVGPRNAAPFAVLSAAYRAAQLFLRDRPAVFPQLIINWSKDNRPESGDKSVGQITTSHWDGSKLYILGKAGVDCDEFDSHVVAHEWAHFFEAKLGRSDSRGGSHSLGDVLDPRVAFAEGFGNAVSAMALYPDSRYSDTFGATQAQGFFFDMEDNDSTDPQPGWFSESSVHAILYDIFDAENEASYDTVALGAGAIYDVIVGAEKTTPALTTIFSFVNGLIAIHPEAQSAINSLLAHHEIDPIADPFASTETHDGGSSDQLPVYHTGHNFSVVLHGGSPFLNYNKLQANRYVKFEATDTHITVHVDCPADVDLFLYKNGRVVAKADNFCSSQTCSEHLQAVDAEPSQTYVLAIEGWHDVAEDYTCDVTIN